MSVRCVDVESVSDLKVFLERGERLGAQSVRMQTFGTVLVSTIPSLTPKGLGDATPLIVAMRTTAIVPTEDTDRVVAIRAILERIARFTPGTAGDISWPPASLSEPWAGIAPPRSGWQVVAECEMPWLRERADGTLGQLADVTTTRPEDALAAVLSEHDDILNAPSGLAATAQSLGFLTGSEPAMLSRAGRWTRLSTAAGHVLSRG